MNYNMIACIRTAQDDTRQYCNLGVGNAHKAGPLAEDVQVVVDSERGRVAFLQE